MTIELRNVKKSFQAGGVTQNVLKGIDLRVDPGEFVAVIGKSGSGKSTLINMITGIDTPSSGEVAVAGTDILKLNRSQLAQWRGRNLGIIFQFFQLLPTLTLLENVMLPMDFCRMYAPKERQRRALELLERVGMASHAHKLPSAVSGGQQQRVAIARSLANDPPIIVADEPTGSLDSKTAESVFHLFGELVEAGKTVVMVTHDNDLASKVQRTVVVADGEVVNQYVIQALPDLDIDQLTQLQPFFRKVEAVPGSFIIREGDEADFAYIITAGEVEVLVRHPSGEDIVVNRLSTGQYFGEIALIRGGARTASIRASRSGTVRMLALDRGSFAGLLSSSSMTRKEMDHVIRKRLSDLAKLDGVRS